MGWYLEYLEAKAEKERELIKKRMEEENRDRNVIYAVTHELISWDDYFSYWREKNEL